jgi:hypothetical protein
MSYPRPIETYHFQANLIWIDGPFKYWARPLSSHAVQILGPHMQGRSPGLTYSAGLLLSHARQIFSPHMQG